LKIFTLIVILSPFIGYLTYNFLSGYLPPQLLSYSVIPLYIIFLLSNKKNIKIPSFLIFYFLYIIYIYIWRLFNGYLEEKGIAKYIFNNYHIYAALLIIIIYNIKFDKAHLNRMSILIRIILIIALIGSLMQLIINPDLFIIPHGENINEGSIYLTRRPSIFTYVSDNDSGITVLAYFSIILSLDSIKKNNLRLTIFISIIGLYSILTNGRYIMIGFLLVTLQLLIKQRFTKILKYLFFFSIAIILAYYIYANWLGFNLHELAEKRLFAEGDIKNTTRYLAYRLFLEYFPQNPIFGTGVHLTDEIMKAAYKGGSSQVHVGYFSHLISYGVVGSFFLFTFWFLLARDLYRKAKITGYYGSFFAFSIFLFANATLVDFNLFYPGIIIALIFSEYYFKNYPNNFINTIQFSKVKTPNKSKLGRKNNIKFNLT
jgi:hypothetical protein